MLSALRIPGYELHEVISETPSKLVIRAFSRALQKSVILKVLKPDCPIDAVARLKHEYQIASSLAKANSDIPGVVKVYSLVKQEDASFLVLEDFGGISLDKIIASQALDVVLCLSIAVQLATVLVSLHQNETIHKDIKPSNIIVNQKTGEIKITDFGIASFKEKNAPSCQLEGSFAYMSPEQTGRINRAVDYRSDFYSLGVTLYEMLAFRQPFVSDDALELIHSHIAKQPPPLTTAPQLAAIVMKLMAKNAEDRYQSAVGLLADLEFCLTQLKANGVIPAFQPGERDKAGQLSFPHKLYGRDKEVETLLNAFATVSNGSSSEIVLISGYSGIGKSALVNEIQQPVTRQRGYFIAGKFDHQRNIPYAAFFQAFESLMRILLVEEERKLLDWRQKLQTALGDNGQVIVEVIPELKLIIGEQPPVPQLSLNETQNRFHLIFRAFISVFAQKEHPLVIFLDDLQWTDTASLLLIQQLISNNDNQCLLLIGAYRDNEVEREHALMQCVREIEKATKIVRLALKPLNLDQTVQLLCDTLDTDENGELVHLASLLLNKSAGNPFFLTQIIKTLYTEGLIKYNFKLQRWKWNIKQIQTVGISDLSVVELMVHNLIKLPAPTQELLKLAACIGHHFNLTTLSIISQTSPTEVTEQLSYALIQGLILPVHNSIFVSAQAEIHEYRFLHDRVQQAAYSLIDSAVYEITHYRIGKLLLHQEPKQIEESLFDIVNQFNLGISQLRLGREQELVTIAELNLIAARKAKASLALTAAAKYLHQAVELLPVDSWRQYYDLTLDIYRERAEIEFLNGNFEFAGGLTYTAIEKVSTNLEKADFYNLLVSQYTRQGRYDDVVNAAKNGLSLLDIYLPEDNCKDIADEELMTAKQNLDNIGINSIANLPKIENKQIEAAVKLLINLQPLVYVSNFTLYTLIVSKAVNLLLKYGNVSESVQAYANFGSIIGSKLGDYQSGYQLGLSAYELSEKLHEKSQKSKVSALLTGWLHCWSKHIKDAAVISRKGYQAGLESGEFMFAGGNLISLLSNLFIQGLPLDSINKEILISYQAATKIQHTILIESIIGIKFAVNDLTNVNSDCLNNIEIYNYSITKPKFIKKCQYQQSFWSLSLYYVCQIEVLYLLDNQDAALDYINQAQQHLVAILGFTISSEYYFYYSLVLAKLYGQCDAVIQEKYLLQIEQNQQQFKVWANNCPENFLHKYLLVEAEIARITGKNWQAVDLYDQAIELAQKNGFIQNEALASELAGLFWENQDKKDFSNIYITKAYRCYDKWGAKAKVKQLEKHYSYLITNSNEETTTSNRNYSLDIATVVKASLALSRELVPSRLNSKLLHLVRENAGAEKVYFIIKQNNQLIIESSFVGDSDDNTVWQRIPVTESYQLPVSLINYIERTQTYLVLDDASQSLEFNTDPYINIIKPLSVLALPIIHTGKLLGVLYLENNLVKGAFTSERVEILQILASQAAISLENARFYTTLEARVAERTQKLETALEELNRAQLQLIQSEKMSGLGQLVAGIAHEINNPVSFIFGNLQHTQEYANYLLELIKLYQNELPNPSSIITSKINEIDLEFISEDLSQIIQSMHNGAKRIKDVVLSLRTFSRLDEATFKEVDIHMGIESTLMILQQKLGNIQVIKDYGDIPQVKCFAGEINQVILNILTNAIDALDVCSNSRIWIKTYLSKDNYIAIEIADNGIGMSQDVLNKIFDPFFTTKPVGKGTGLGLSICYQIIVDKHQGKLTCTSAPNQGSKFTILLPR